MSSEKSASIEESESAGGVVLPGEGMKIDNDSEAEEDDEQYPDEEWDGLSDRDEKEVSDGEQEHVQYQRELEDEAA